MSKSEKRLKSKKRKSNKTDEDSKKIKVENYLIDKIQAQSGVRGKLVFVYQENENPYVILRDAAVAEGFQLEINADPHNVDPQTPNTYELRINDEVIVKGKFDSLTAARSELSRIAFRNLQYSCFSIIKKQTAYEIEKVQIAPDVFQKPSSKKDDKFDSNSETFKNNIGARIMKLMGWSGGGLGLEEQGNKNLVQNNGQADRGGLGQSRPDEIKQLIEEYANNDEIDSLAFSDEFTKEQRALMHTIAAKYNLRSKSYGKGANRMLVIRKKPHPWNMVRYLLEHQKETSEYKLLLPFNEEDLCDQ